MKKNYFWQTLWLAFALLLSIRQTNQAGSAWQVEYSADSDASQPTLFRESVSTLTNSEVFPGSPDQYQQLDDWSVRAGQFPLFGLQGRFSGPAFGTDYGTWISGYLEAPLTGQYILGIASADNSQFWLSTNYAASNEVLVAYEPGTGEALFTGNRLDTRNSAPLNLVKGQKYYFDVFQQVGPGPGYVQIGWIRPDGVQELIPALHLAQNPINPYLESYAPADTAQVPPGFNISGQYLGPGGLNEGNITNQANLTEGGELLLQLDVIASQPTTFVWKTNGVVVPGQNLSYFEIDHTPASYNNVKVQGFVSNPYGNLASAVATVSVTPDTTPPTVAGVDTAGNPFLVEVTYSKPVNPATATNVANYQVAQVGGGILAVTNASLSADQTVVTLTGNFNFGIGSNYVVTIKNITDQADVPNPLSPNPTTAPFALSAPLGNTYTFASGQPAGINFYGSAQVETNNSENPPGGATYLALTDAAQNENGAVLLTARQNIDQAHISFYTRISDASDITGSGSVGGDGFSLNLSADLPLGTFNTPQLGYGPPVPEPQLSIYFNTRYNGILNPVEIGVSLNDSVLTNIPAGTNYEGIFSPVDGIPPLTSEDGHWAPVDINLQRDGTLNLTFDGVIVLTNYQTGWIGINGAQLGLAAATENWDETHWIADLYVNYQEGNVGGVGLSTNSVLGGVFPEGSTVNLVAIPTGAGPDTYQWYENGAPIPGATDRLLSFPAVVGAGGSFSISVSNQFSGIISTPQSVVIKPNLNPPTLLSVSAIAGSINEVFLSFDQTLDVPTATSPSTYYSPYFAVNSVSLGNDGRSVVLHTTQQRYGTTYPLTITGLEDDYASKNALNTNLTFVSNLSYDDEVLGDQPVRYYKLNETSGTVAYTEAVGGDTVNTNGTYQDLPGLGQPGIVPSDVNNSSVLFVSAHTNQVAVPNNGDINVTRGPWSQRTIELWFNANRFPIGAQKNDSAINAQTHAVSGLWEEGGNLRDIGIYLFNNTGITNPATASLAFTAYNSTDDGPGSPFGLLQYPAVYITTPVSTNVTYHVVGVLDGDPNGRTGELRLYVNSVLVGRTTNGVGQIYDHNGSVHIGGGNGRSHLNVSGLWGYFDGLIQDVSIYDTVLSSNQITAHYLAGTGASLVTTAPPTLVDTVDPQGNPRQLTVTFNQPVSSSTAVNLANYVLQTGGGTALPIQSAQLAADLVTVTLSLSPGYSFQPGNSYNLTVSGVADVLSAPNVVATTNLAFAFVTAGSVGIANSSSLGNQTVIENQPASFFVNATGQTPYYYQWYENGVPLAGQTNATLAFNAAWNSGGGYSVVVSNEFSSVTSSPAATLTVLADTNPPAIISLRALAGTLNEIILTFNKPVNPAAATNLATYSIPTASVTGLSLLGASLATNGAQVTLTTTPQVHGQTNEITITNLKDDSHVPNTLTVTAQFVSTISYRDELLAEPGIVRYFTFDQTNGTAIPSLVSKYDTSPLNLVGTLVGYPTLPTLGVPGLVPNVPNNTAVSFNGYATNRIQLPNGADISSTLGPWYQIIHVFTFKANGLPSAVINSTITNYPAPTLYSDYQNAIYLYATTTNVVNPNSAQLVFESQQTSSLGVGSPWGGNTPATARYITYTVQTNVVYNVVAVVDGNATFTGELRLYINGVRVGTVGGIGAVYPNPNDPPNFSQGYLTTYTDWGKTINPELTNATTVIDEPFNGVLDEFALLNDQEITDARVAQLYAYGQTNYAATATSFVILPNATPGLPILRVNAVNNGHALSFAWPAGAAGYYLESTTNLASGIWLSNTVSPVAVNGTNVVVQPVSTTGNQFFRLHHP